MICGFCARDQRLRPALQLSRNSLLGNQGLGSAAGFLTGFLAGRASGTNWWKRSSTPRPGRTVRCVSRVIALPQ